MHLRWELVTVQLAWPQQRRLIAGQPPGPVVHPSPPVQQLMMTLMVPKALSEFRFTN
jgi:hypothetical protein